MRPAATLVFAPARVDGKPVRVRVEPPIVWKVTTEREGPDLPDTEPPMFGTRSGP